MGDYHVDQTGASAGGHLAGRDVNLTEIHQPAPSYLRATLTRLKEERANDEEFHGIICALEHFQISTDKTLRTLDEKLSAGGRDDLVANAIREKELFSMQLSEHMLWRSAQQFYALVLATIKDRFTKSIVPMLQSNTDNHIIDSAIVEHVIEPCIKDMEDNPLGIGPAHIHGMVYYLTGNCFMEWERGE